MTWLELYNFLYEKANDLKNIGEFDWQEPVLVQGLNKKIELNIDQKSHLVFKKANTN